MYVNCTRELIDYLISLASCYMNYIRKIYRQSSVILGDDGNSVQVMGKTAPSPSSNKVCEVSERDSLTVSILILIKKVKVKCVL